MIDIKQIESFYPKELAVFKRNLLREYLQYKILEIIFDSKFGEKLAFMGGTACRIVYGNTRFSEDLDFDNRGLDKDGFEKLSLLIKNKLEMQGYQIEIKNVLKGAFRTYIRFPNLLFEIGLTSHENEKIMIHVDMEPQNFNYIPDKIILNKFDVFLNINVVPINILLAQKIYAIFKRKRSMGRDFYDTVFLMCRTSVNYEYLKEKLNIAEEVSLKNKLLEKCEELDFKILSKDVEPFLFYAAENKKVLLFKEYIGKSK